MATPGGDATPRHLVDTDEMTDNEYDSDSTNMSVSISSVNSGTIRSASELIHHEEQSSEIEIEPGSPVIGERIIQDGIVLSQRASERIRTPILLSETDSEEELNDRPVVHREAVLRTPFTLPLEVVESSTSSSSSRSGNRQSPVPEPFDSHRRQSIVDQSVDNNIQYSVESSSSSIIELPTNDRSVSPLPEHSTSNSRLVTLPRQSSSAVRLSPELTRQWSSDMSRSPVPDHSTSDRQEQSVAGTDQDQQLIQNQPTEEQKPKSCETSKQSNKVLEKAPLSPESDEDGQTCSICFECWSNSGTHRLASLKCGHIFGNSCIAKWLKGKGGKCPQCNAKATKKDIRVIYAKSLKAVDTSEKDQLIKELEKEKEARQKLERNHAQTKLQCDLKSQMVINLQKELKNLIARSSMNNLQGIVSSQDSSSGTKSKLVIHSCVDIVKDGGCRVMAYNEWLNMLVVSMPSPVTMFPGCGVKKINMLDVKAERYVPIQLKQIRDLAFNPAKNDLLLSVGMDKLVKLTNMCNNALVGSFSADAPLWCCCWNLDQANQFFVGTATGTVIVYDTRNTTGPVQTFKVSGSGPVVSMTYIPFNASANFYMGGLLVARLSSCSFVIVQEEGVKEHVLLLEGTFTSVSFDKFTRHLLVSCRPSHKYPHARHLFCELQNVNVSTDATALSQVVTVNVISKFHGGTTQSVISRSCLVIHPFQEGTVLACVGNEVTQDICIWDTSSGACLQRLKCNGNIIDIMQIKSDQSAYMALLTDKFVKFYKWVDTLYV